MPELELMDICANCCDNIFIHEILMNNEFFSKDIHDFVASDETDQVNTAVLNRDIFWRELKAFWESFGLSIAH